MLSADFITGPEGITTSLAMRLETITIARPSDYLLTKGAARDSQRAAEAHVSDAR